MKVSSRAAKTSSNMFIVLSKRDWWLSMVKKNTICSVLNILSGRVGITYATSRRITSISFHNSVL